MPVGEVEVEAQKVFVRRGFARILGQTAGIVAVLAHQDVAKAVGLADDAGVGGAELLARGAVEGPPGGLRLLAEIDIEEKEHLVPADRAAETEAVFLVLEVAELAQRVRAVADQRVVTGEVEHGPFPVVRAAAGDGVDATTGEATLADVGGGEQQLDLLNGVEADRRRPGLAAGGSRIREAEEVVVHRAVDRDVVIAAAAAGHRDRFFVFVLGAVGEEGIGAGEVLEPAVDGGQGLERLAMDVRRRAGCARG